MGRAWALVLKGEKIVQEGKIEPNRSVKFQVFLIFAKMIEKHEF